MVVREIVLLFCPSWYLNMLYWLVHFTMQELVQFTWVLAEAFRCHVHHFQCLTVPVELGASAKNSSKLNKFLHSEVIQLIQPTRDRSIFLFLFFVVDESFWNWLANGSTRDSEINILLLCCRKILLCTQGLNRSIFFSGVLEIFFRQIYCPLRF